MLAKYWYITFYSLAAHRLIPPHFKYSWMKNEVLNLFIFFEWAIIIGYIPIVQNITKMNRQRYKIYRNNSKKYCQNTSFSSTRHGIYMHIHTYCYILFTNIYLNEYWHIYVNTHIMLYLRRYNSQLCLHWPCMILLCNHAQLQTNARPIESNDSACFVNKLSDF
jgi:hypothetical protein